MPFGRLLALAICGYLTPVVRKPLRSQPSRCHHHLSSASSAFRKISALSSAGVTTSCRLPVRTTSAAMASTSPQDGERFETTTTTTATPGSGDADDDDDVVLGRLESAAEVYRYLRGGWDLEKIIVYKRGGLAGTWKGVARFTPQQQFQQQQQEQRMITTTTTSTLEAAKEEGYDDTTATEEVIDPSLVLRYAEQGIFRVDGKGVGFEAGQRLVYNCGNNRAGGGPVRVHFVDDPKQPDALRFFHELDFRRPTTTATAAENQGAKSSAAEVVGVAGSAAVGGEGAVAPQRPRANFEHLCVRDLYRGEVEVVGPDEFRTR